MITVDISPEMASTFKALLDSAEKKKRKRDKKDKKEKKSKKDDDDK